VVDRPSNRRIALIVVLAAVTLAATSILVSNIQGADIGTGGQSIQTFTNKIVEVMTTSLYVLWIGIFVYFMIGLVGSRGKVRSKGTAVASSNSNLVFGLIVLALWIVFIRYTGLRFSFFNGDGEAQNGGSLGDGSNPSSIGGGMVPGIFVFIFLAILLVSSLAVYFRYMRSPSLARYKSAAAMTGSEKGVGLVEKAVEELYRGDDFGGVIIRMYQQMCRLLRDEERSGHEFLTPREFAVLATQKFGWPEDPVNELTLLFEEARYSDHRIDEHKKERATKCLEGVRNSIGLGARNIAGGGIAPVKG
jgi:hypothetical protein